MVAGERRCLGAVDPLDNSGSLCIGADSFLIMALLCRPPGFFGSTRQPIASELRELPPRPDQRKCPCERDRPWHGPQYGGLQSQVAKNQLPSPQGVATKPDVNGLQGCRQGVAMQANRASDFSSASKKFKVVKVGSRLKETDGYAIRCPLRVAGSPSTHKLA
jgi:hypothetical protein